MAFVPTCPGVHLPASLGLRTRVFACGSSFSPSKNSLAKAPKDRKRRTSEVAFHYESGGFYCQARKESSSSADVIPSSRPQKGIKEYVMPEPPAGRTAYVHRETGETKVTVSVNLDGTGRCNVDTGIPFLDHMLHQISSHGLIDLEIQAEGDLHIDDHHTNEDVGITLGMALGKALGDKKGIFRFGNFTAPLDEALVQVVLDFSGRPHLTYGLDLPTDRVGTYDTQLVREFYVAVASNSNMTLHVRQLDGINTHHIIEASFKAFARAMRQAVSIDERRIDSIPSSKGVLGSKGF